MLISETEVKIAPNGCGYVECEMGVENPLSSSH